MEPTLDPLDVSLPSVDLSISSGTTPMDAKTLASWICEQNVSAEVHPLHSSVPCGGNGLRRVESGVRVVLFGVTPRMVRDRIWPALRERYDLQCGYIRIGHQYCGCVLNWPGVFRPSLCPTSAAASVSSVS